MHLFFLGAPPRRGNVTWRVALGGMARVDRERGALVEVVRCFPAWTRRRVDGAAEVRRERRWRRVEMEVEAGMVRGIARRMLVEKREGRRRMAYFHRRVALRRFAESRGFRKNRRSRKRWRMSARYA